MICASCNKPLENQICTTFGCEQRGKLQPFPFHLLPQEFQQSVVHRLSNSEAAKLARTSKANNQLVKTSRRLVDIVKPMGSMVVLAGGEMHSVKDQFTHHHSVMQKLDSEAQGTPMAWLVNVKPKYVAQSVSTGRVTGTAIINVIKHGIETSWKKTTECFVYANHMPSEADLGIFIEQLKLREHRLICKDKERLYVFQPRKESKRNLLAVFNLKPTSSTAVIVEPELKKKEADAYTTADTTKAETAQPVLTPGKHHKAYLIPCKNGLPYEKISPAGQQLFDSIFIFLTYVLASPIALRDHDQECKLDKLDPHQVGAVMVSSSGDILCWGIDFNKLCHAEVSTLLQAYDADLGNPKDLQVRFYTSLEPCFMCSGHLSEFSKELGSLTVLYGQIDPAVHQKFDKGVMQPTEHTFLKWHLDVSEVLVDASHDGALKSATKLEDKRKWLDTQQKQLMAQSKPQNGGEQRQYERELMNWEKKSNKFANSVMAAKADVSYNRRFIKSLLHLVDMIQRITLIENKSEQGFLVEVWSNALLLLEKIEGTKIEDLVLLACQELQNTRGQNQFKDYSSVQRRVTDYTQDEFKRVSELLEKYYRG